jgi:hypothetical protein
MLIRFNVKCLTCEAPYTLRISLGNNSNQKHTIACLQCREDFVVTLNLDAKGFQCTENCEEVDEVGKIINVSPYCPIPSDKIHEDRIFPWMDRVIEDFELGNRLSQFHNNVSSASSPLLVFDAYELLGGQILLLENWKILKKGWSLTLNNQLDLAKNQFLQYEQNLFNEAPDLDHVLFDFSSRLISPAKHPLFSEVANLYFDLYRSRKVETIRFRNYYLQSLRKESLERYFDIYCQYFRNHNEFAQTELYVKNDVALPNNLELASNAFNDIKLFYGNAFESLTTGFTILACLNNILCGRNFDEFKSMDLKKYLTINKARRAEPFQDEPRLHAFANSIDSTLRNASHHGAMKLVKHKNEIVFRSGGTGSEQRIGYVSYLVRCNEIMFSVAALTSLELLIAFETN